MTCIYSLCGGPSRVCIFLSASHLASRPGHRPEGAREAYGQADRPREAAGGGTGKGGHKTAPARRKRRGSGQYRCPRLCVTNYASQSGNWRGNSRNSRQKVVDLAENGELASLCTRKYRGEISLGN